MLASSPTWTISNGSAVLSLPLSEFDRGLLLFALDRMLTDPDTTLEASALQRCLALQAQLQAS